jgi:hypothetical protein
MRLNLYMYDKGCLQFKRLTVKQLSVSIAVLLSTTACVTFGLIDKNTHIYEGALNVYLHKPAFTEDKLVQQMGGMNLRFPHIALAQAKLESSRYKSLIFKENNNLFGMKEAKQRITLAKGTRRNHAYYDTWEDSVLDYAFWCATYANKCKTEQQFYTLLSTYAKDPMYESKLRKIVEKEGLKEKFNN